MSSRYGSAKILIKFVNSAMTLDSFFTEVKKLNNTTGLESKPATDLTDEELSHENAHASEWEKRGIKSEFYRDENGPYTEPREEDLMNYTKVNNVTKNQFIDIFRDVVNAPTKAGFTLDGTDEIYYKILTGQILSDEDLLSHRINKIAQTEKS